MKLLKTIALFILTEIALTVIACGQAKIAEKLIFTEMTCVEDIPAVGEHVRFTAEEHVKILLANLRSSESYRKWEIESRFVRWFDGQKPVSLESIKVHMPRAMLLSSEFPVDQHPKVNPDDLKRLIEAESEYNESTKNTQDWLRSLIAKYGVGPEAVFDQDLGGITPRAGCGKFAEKKLPIGR